jgi:GH24 family phage-related lysozyme (muramidase)
MYLDDAVKATAAFEGRVHWMYLDSKEGVTVGVGQYIPTAQDAPLYPFRRPNAEAASKDEILAEYESVRQMAPGHVAMAYRRSTSLLLTDDDIDQILRRTMAQCVTDLAALFPGFHDYPDQAKIALLDMCFNLGITKLRDEYPRFCAMVKDQRWVAASLECNRVGPSRQRNEWTKEQFMLASTADVEEYT